MTGRAAKDAVFVGEMAARRRREFVRRVVIDNKSPTLAARAMGITDADAAEWLHDAGWPDRARARMWLYPDTEPETPALGDDTIGQLLAAARKSSPAAATMAARIETAVTRLRARIDADAQAAQTRDKIAALKAELAQLRAAQAQAPRRPRRDKPADGPCACGRTFRTAGGLANHRRAGACQ